MASTLCLSLILAAPLLWGVAAFAQQSPAAVAPASSQMGAAGTLLDVVVTAKDGRVVGGLEQKDFKLLDDKVPTPITSFRAVGGAGAPVQVLLVVDAVNVPYVGVSYVRGQVENFLRANQGKLTFPTELAIFTDTGTQMQKGLSKNGNAEAEVLDNATVNLRSINRSAGYWGAEERFEKSIAEVRSLMEYEAGRPGRKLMVWVSPGWPLLSGPGVDLDDKQERQIFAEVVALSTELREAGITLYDVDPIGAAEGLGRVSYYESFLKGVSKPGDVDPADLSLQVLAAESGGLVLTSNNDLIGELERSVADGTAYYEIGFAPPPSEHGDQYHSLSLQMAEPGLKARTWTGYYAQP